MFAQRAKGKYLLDLTNDCETIRQDNESYTCIGETPSQMLIHYHCDDHESKICKGKDTERVPRGRCFVFQFEDSSYDVVVVKRMQLETNASCGGGNERIVPKKSVYIQRVWLFIARVFSYIFMSYHLHHSLYSYQLYM